MSTVHVLPVGAALAADTAAALAAQAALATDTAAALTSAAEATRDVVIEIEPLLLRASEAAAVLRVSERQIYRLVARGDLEQVHIGAAARIPMASLRAYVARLPRSGSTS